MSPELLNYLISELNLDVVGGKIAKTRANIARITQSMDLFREFLLNPENSPYVSAVRSFSAEFETQRQLTTGMLSAFGQVPSSAEVVWAAGRARSIELLLGNSMQSEFLGAISDTLVNSVQTGSSFRDMTIRLTQVFNGDGQVEGKLLNWSKQVAHDRFAMTDRAFANDAYETMDIEWYRYVGGKIDQTRCFCDNRNNQYYHREEIASWGRGENIGDCATNNGWAGRMQGTNESTIFIMLGGYRCQHSIVPASTIEVPREKLLEAIQKGWWTPTEFEKTELNL